MFESTGHFFKQFTSINDFAQVCAASVWTMRWQVKGFFAEAGFYASPSTKPTQADLKARFLSGSGLKRANFRSLVDGQTWEGQEELLAEMSLLTIISLFEGWADALADEVGLSRRSRDALQWPSHAAYPRFDSRNRPFGGIDVSLTEGRRHISAVMRDCFYPGFQASADYRLAELDPLLVCYRYWKAIRNCLVHAGGVPDAYTIGEEVKIQKLTPAMLGMGRIPRLPPITAGSRLQLRLNEVLQFGEVLHKIVTTVDAELSVNEHAESIMLTRWEEVQRRYYSDPPLTPPKRHGRIAGQMRSANLPPPKRLEALDDFLTTRYGKLLVVR